MEGPRNNYEIAEVWPSMRYEPGAEYRRSPLLDKLLSQAGFQPYALQQQDSIGRWETCLDLQFDTLEEAQAAAAARSGRVAAMVLVERYEPVKGA